ncbi:hypothetical protein [Nocardia macrotermitis]|uniref:Secreted protein n=1 Tax=Nocardia macrotermitis TaxID=2585198 RepID=A0A7K0D8B9_9NOCA|nr:hypothetical protein [Nocardia macrotermitis]MQY22035.1 hypothetical protein [Nocardia macrotermitis]
MNLCTSLAAGFAVLAAGAGLALVGDNTAAAVPVNSVPADSVTGPARMGGDGSCYLNWVHKDQQSVNMWCAGSGPERYGVTVQCTKNGKNYQYNSENTPVYGDRGGAVATCKEGTATTWWPHPA